MDCENKEDFENKAKLYIYRSVKCRGNEFKQFNEIDCYNTIAAAFGYEVIPPKTEKDEKDLNEGNYFFYSDKAKEHARIILKQIETISTMPVQLKIVPLALYRNEKMYQLPLFCIKTEKEWKYLDDSGRIYRDVAHWRETNVLPAGILAYPKYLRMDDQMSVSYEKSPETEMKRKVWKILDGISTSLGIISVIPGIIIPGGQIITLAVLLYGMGRSAYKVYDRYDHGQSISLRNSDARKLWLSIAASGVSCLAIGVLWRVNVLASRGEVFGQTALNIINTVNIANHVVTTASVLNDTVYVLSNWKKISKSQKCLMFAQMAFLALSTFNFKTADQLINKYRTDALDHLTNKMPAKDVEKIRQLKAHIGEQQLLKQIYTKTQTLKVSPQTALDMIVNKTLQPVDVLVEPSKISKIGSIFIDTLKGYTLDQITEKIANVDRDLCVIVDTFPQKVQDFVQRLSDKLIAYESSLDKLDACDSSKFCLAVYGLMANGLANIDTVGEIAQDDTGKHWKNGEAIETLETAFNSFGFDDSTTLNENVWKKLVEHFDKQNAHELFESIKDFQVPKKLVGLHPVMVDVTDKELKDWSQKPTDEALKLEILISIEHGEIKFGSELAAIYHYIGQGLTNNIDCIEQFLKQANKLICRRNFDKFEEKTPSRFFHFKNKTTEETAIVSEESGYLKFCFVKMNKVN